MTPTERAAVCEYLAVAIAHLLELSNADALGSQQAVSLSSYFAMHARKAIDLRETLQKGLKHG